MSRLLGLAILAVLLYVAVTRGMPWLKTAMERESGPGAGASDSSACVAAAATAADTLADELVPNARPPVDPGVWGTALVRASGKLAAAESACACPTAACATATGAVHELRALFDELDDLARGNAAGFGNPARRQERAYDLLDEARALARSE